jgi:hypothetical protein
MSSEIRELTDADLPEAVRVLCEGFPHRSAAYWQRGLEHMTRLAVLPQTTRYGLGLHVDGTMRGVILAIPSHHVSSAGAQTIVNLSSWCVHPGHRGRAALQLYAQACSGPPEITYTNLSATAHTLKAVAARGFRESTAGQMLCIGTRPSPGTKRFVPPAQALAAGLSAPMARTLVDHEALGCLAVCLETPAKLIPLIFLKRRVKGLPLAQLIYCESLADLAAHGLAITAWLAGRGHPAMIVDASGPVPGLRGRYFDGKARKFYKGPPTLLAVDHSYTEMMYFGL